MSIHVRSFIKRQTSGTASDNEWQQVTTSDNEWQRITKSDNEWPFRLIFFFFQVKEEPTIKHPKENSLRGPLKKAYWIKSRSKHSRRNINSKKQEKNYCVGVPFQESCRSWNPQVYSKETPTQVFSYEYCEIFKNIFFYRTTLVAASGI